MAVLRIRERDVTGAGFRAELSFDDGGAYEIAVRDPFSEPEEARLEWYFERYLRFPFVDEVRFRDAAASVQRYGEDLFAQMPSTPAHQLNVRVERLFPAQEELLALALIMLVVLATTGLVIW